MQNPCKMIGSLGVLVARVQKHVDSLADTCESVGAQWQGLVNACGAREDHAADIMYKQLRPEVEELRRFLGRVVDQIDEMEKNPFGRQVEAASA